jgi:hypothetical protein
VPIDEKVRTMLMLDGWRPDTAPGRAGRYFSLDQLREGGTLGHLKRPFVTAWTITPARLRTDSVGAQSGFDRRAQSAAEKNHDQDDNDVGGD